MRKPGHPKFQPRKTNEGVKKPVRETHWGDVAEWYDKLVGDEGSEFHREVILPGILRMLGIGNAKRETRNAKLRVADLACGQGVLCRKLAQADCEVVGVDAAATLIEAARKRNAAEGLAIRYEVADVTKLVDEHGKLAGNLPAGGFDAVTIVLAIQNMTPLSPVWKAVHGLLKVGGQLIVVMMHPCFRNPRQTDWTWDEKRGEEGRTVFEYLTSGKVEIQTHPGLAAHGKDDSATPNFHRPLQAYVNTMGNAGLLIDHVAEWVSHKVSQPGPKKAALDKARKEIPMFLALRARKVG